MKAYKVECICGEKTDRIIKSNEILKCKCGNLFKKLGGPIGGINILPIGIYEEDRFVPYFSNFLNKKVNNINEMKKAYDEMYSLKAIDIKPIETEIDNKKEIEIKESKPKRGRKKIVESDGFTDDKNDEDLNV